MSKKSEAAIPKEQNLVGLFGHTLDKDKFIVWQFIVVREISQKRYLVQLYSWFSGEATQAKVLAEYQLLGSRCNLYLNREDWTAAADKNNYRRKVKLDAEEGAK